MSLIIKKFFKLLISAKKLPSWTGWKFSLLRHVESVGFFKGSTTEDSGLVFQSG